MKRILRLALAATVVVGLAIAPRPAQAVIVERIVAVIGDKPILLSELRQRAKPQITILAAQSGGDPTRIAVAEPQIMKSTLNQMIDERLMEQQADRAHISITVPQIDEAIKNKAAGLKVSVKDLLAVAARQGFTEQDYRDEVRRQLLEGRLIQLRVSGRVKVTETDARAAYIHLVKQLDDESPVDLQVLAMRIPPSAAAVDAKLKLADEIVARATTGEDWCDLVKQFSDDLQTRDMCGDPGPQPIRNIHPEARGQLTGMKPGDISKPVRIGDQAIVIFRLKKREVIPPFDEVKDQMYEQATEEAVMRQRDLWVLELRRGVYLDVRL
ncbi:SurA N-terminal domain-containing protein [soil metagenome]